MNNIDVLKMLDEYYGKGLTETQLRIYIKTLIDIPTELLNMAGEYLIKNGHPFMPKVAEIRKAAKTIKREGKYEPVDPLKLIPGAAQTQEDLDERYGTKEEWEEIEKIFIAEKYDELTEEQNALLKGHRL